MQFDFERFSTIAESVYNEGLPGGFKHPYSLSEYLDVFYQYFKTYEEWMKRPHPPIRYEQIEWFTWIMPFFGFQDFDWAIHQSNNTPLQYDIEPFAYPVIIGLHFKTMYRNCDYNINHFFSGRIRELRYHEIR